MMRLTVMLKNMLDAVLDVIMPLRARSARTKERRAEDVPLTPTVHELLGAQITTLMDYRNEAVQDLVRALKYDRSPHAARLAAELLADYLREEIASIHMFSTKKIVLIPVPLHAARRRERGFNQIEWVLESLTVEFKDGTLAEVAPRGLKRTRATDPQTKLSRKERIKNVVGAFEVANMSRVQDTHVFLIADVDRKSTRLNSSHMS